MLHIFEFNAGHWIGITNGAPSNGVGIKTPSGPSVRAQVSYRLHLRCSTEGRSDLTSNRTSNSLTLDFSEAYDVSIPRSSESNENHSRPGGFGRSIIHRRPGRPRPAWISLFRRIVKMPTLPHQLLYYICLARSSGSSVSLQIAPRPPPCRPCTTLAATSSSCPSA